MKTNVVLLTLFLSAGCFAQQAELSFEAASIRANTDPLGDRPGRPNPQLTSTSLTMSNEPFLFVIEWAYDIPAVQIDGPVWIPEPRFDISAKISSPSTETDMRRMLRKLLADRFGFKTHTESRTMQAYAITLAKGGPKFQEAANDGSFTLERTNSLILMAHHARVADLAQGIASEIGRPVVDETGLTGRYELRVNLAPYVTRAPDPGAGNPGQLDMMSILFTGLQEQLGLKLESRKSPVDILVIDHTEKVPTEN